MFLDSSLTFKPWPLNLQVAWSDLYGDFNADGSVHYRRNANTPQRFSKSFGSFQVENQGKVTVEKGEHDQYYSLNVLHME